MPVRGSPAPRVAARLGVLPRAVRALCAVAMLQGTVVAQQRPLLTEDPECIGAGRILVEAGIDQGWDRTFRTSGLEGDLLRAPALGISIGLSSIADLQIDGGAMRLAVTNRRSGPLADAVAFTGDSTWSADDVIVATKIRVISETPRRPGFGVRLATKLPTSSTESGIGVDTTDVFGSFLVGKTVGSVRVVGNLGLGILSDPTKGSDQSDVLTYGLSVARAFSDRAELVGEVNGRAYLQHEAAPAGLESRGRALLGARYTFGAGRFDAGVFFGLTEVDATVGVTAGFTYVFEAFRVP